MKKTVEDINFNKKIKVVYFATPDIAIESLKKLVESEDFDVAALVTQPPKPSKRGKKIADSNIKKYAIEKNIEILEPYKISKEPDMLEKLKSLNADFFVTFAFGQILSQEVLDIPLFYTINLHASLLPKYRGANPICECLMQGDKFTGITTMITVLELDAGDICISEPIEITEDTNFLELSKKISELSPDLIEKTLKNLYNKTLVPTPQDKDAATFTKKMQKEDKKLCFDSNAIDFHNKVRAMCGINTTHTEYKGKLIKIIKTKIINCDDKYNNYKNGEVIDVSCEGILVKCGCGAILILTVKPEGKGEMSSYSWSLGSKIKKGDILGC